MNAPSRKPLSAVEWQIFRIVLTCPPYGAGPEWVRQELAKQSPEDRGISTVTTFLVRMRDKGWLRSELVPRSILKEQQAAAGFPENDLDDGSIDYRRKPALIFLPLASYEEGLVSVVSNFFDQFQVSPDDVLAVAAKTRTAPKDPKPPRPRPAARGY